MDLLSRVGGAGLNLSRTLTDQAHRVATLSTGLRIRSAADDPSGLAIAQTLSSRVAGLQTGSENVQNAVNLLTVAGGALRTTGAILQRIHSLAIEAASDLNSAQQLGAIQTEIDALKHEIDQIATKTQFNGTALLNGSIDGRGAIAAFVQEIAAAPVNGNVPSRTVSNADGLGNPGLLVQNVTVGNGVEAATIEFSVVGYDTNAVDPIIGPIGGPGLYVQVIAYSTDPSFGAGKQLTSITAIAENAGPQSAALTTPSGSNTFLQFTIANLTSADVGAAQAFTTYKDLPAGGGSALAINGGGGEGTILQVSVPKVSAQTLGVADVSVVVPTAVDDFNNAIGFAGSNATAAVDAQVRANAAIQLVAALAAQIGAQTVSLQEDGANAEIAAQATRAAQSAIEDADIAAESTSYAKDGVLAAVGESVLISAQDSARAFAQAMSDNIAGPPPRADSAAPLPSTPAPALTPKAPQ